MLKNRILLVVIGISLTIGLIVFVLSQQVVHQCEALLKAQPTIDVFPNSEILTTTTDRTGEDYSVLPTLLGAEHYSMVTTKYVTDTDYNAVISFYQQRGKCDDVKEGTITACYGDVEPVGKYYIGIDSFSSTPRTYFYIQLKRSLCGTKF